MALFVNVETRVLDGAFLELQDLIGNASTRVLFAGVPIWLLI